MMISIMIIIMIDHNDHDVYDRSSSSIMMMIDHVMINHDDDHDDDDLSR